MGLLKCCTFLLVLSINDTDPDMLATWPCLFLTPMFFFVIICLIFWHVSISYGSSVGLQGSNAS